MLDTHFINKDILEVLLRGDFGPNDFREYLLARKKLIIDYIGELIGV